MSWCDFHTSYQTIDDECRTDKARSLVDKTCIKTKPLTKLKGSNTYRSRGRQTVLIPPSEMVDIWHRKHFQHIFTSQKWNAKRVLRGPLLPSAVRGACSFELLWTRCMQTWSNRCRRFCKNRQGWKQTFFYNTHSFLNTSPLLHFELPATATRDSRQTKINVKNLARNTICDRLWSQREILSHSCETGSNFARLKTHVN